MLRMMVVRVLVIWIFRVLALRATSYTWSGSSSSRSRTIGVVAAALGPNVVLLVVVVGEFGILKHAVANTACLHAASQKRQGTCRALRTTS